MNLLKAWVIITKANQIARTITHAAIALHPGYVVYKSAILERNAEFQCSECDLRSIKCGNTMLIVIESLCQLASQSLAFKMNLPQTLRPIWVARIEWIPRLKFRSFRCLTSIKKWDRICSLSSSRIWPGVSVQLSFLVSILNLVNNIDIGSRPQLLTRHWLPSSRILISLSNETLLDGCSYSLRLIGNHLSLTLFKLIHAFIYPYSLTWPKSLFHYYLFDFNV